MIIGYLRVSTQDQADNGYGLEAQRSTIGAEAARRDWSVTWVEETGSGKDVKRRPKLEAALSLLGQGDTLVVAKLDRLSRSVRDFADIVERSRREGWALVLLDLHLDTSTPMGEAMANMAVVFAQLERRMIGQRTKEGLAIARAAGRSLGGPTRIKPDVVCRIRRMHAEGMTYLGIATQLNDDGVPTATKAGKQWYASTVRAVVLRGGTS